MNYRFRPNTVKSIIETILNEELSGKQYDSSQTGQLTRTITDKIKHKIQGKKISPYFTIFTLLFILTELNHTRYKIVVQVLIGEQKGEGLRISTRCLWDPDADNYASHTFISVSQLSYNTKLKSRKNKTKRHNGFSYLGFPILCSRRLWRLLLLKKKIETDDCWMVNVSQKMVIFISVFTHFSCFCSI